MGYQYEKLLDRDNSLQSHSFVSFIVMFIIAIVLFGVYYGSIIGYTDVWETSKLISGSVGTSSDGSRCYKNCYYYVNEHFQKNTNNVSDNIYCTVIRQTPHYTFTAASNEVASLKIGTYRKIYYYAYSNFWGTCADSKIYDYYFNVAWTLFAIAVVGFVGCIGIISSIAIIYFFEELKSNEKINGKDINNATNLSSRFCCICWNKCWLATDTNGDGVISISEILTAIKFISINLFSVVWRDIKYPFIILWNYCHRKNDTFETQV